MTREKQTPKDVALNQMSKKLDRFQTAGDDLVRELEAIADLPSRARLAVYNLKQILDESRIVIHGETVRRRPTR